MIRIVFLLWFCLAVTARAQTPPARAVGGVGFDFDAMENVQAEAIDFMVPRTLEVTTAAQLAMWGLSGLTTIDPALSADARDTKVELLVKGRVALQVPLPGTDAISWARAVAAIVAAGWTNSLPMRQAGQPAVTKVLLDEMLAHLDPYSRTCPRWKRSAIATAGSAMPVSG